ncbi:MAG: SUMF1/EgtB/PvdO family nonheme iron enzyme [Phycisphaerae bacterium]|nr:SUMF1/EgtB/PvdO family nonheme iron enzyme [Phycisphaerae bacterium]
MRQLVVGAAVCTFVLLGAAVSVRATAPEVANVQASQRPDSSKLIDITYDLIDADGDLCTVWVRVSDDGGATWTVPAQTLSGSVGPNVQPGAGKTITWDAGADIPGKSGSIRLRVYADDGNGMANMVFVPAGGTPSNYVAAFWIDKYEVTNLRYCEFLNAADPNGTRWNSNMEITKNGTTYAVDAGYQDYPVRYVSYYDATAFAAWLSQRENRNYRLPTQQEWEKAAGWDPVEEHHYTYGFHSDSISCGQCNYMPSSGNYCVGNTAPVGSYPGSSYYGCFDMSGNLWEWTSSPYYDNTKTIRGGAWNVASGICLVTYRSSGWPSDRISTYGFRLALDLE